MVKSHKGHVDVSKKSKLTRRLDLVTVFVGEAIIVVHGICVRLVAELNRGRELKDLLELTANASYGHLIRSVRRPQRYLQGRREMGKERG